MSRSRIAISGPPLDRDTIASLEALGQTIHDVDIVEQGWASLEGCWAHILGGAETLDEASVALLPSSVELVCFLGTGFESYMDVRALAARGIATCFTPHANATATAEFAVGLIITGLRAVPIGISQVARCEWDPPQGLSPAGSSVGVVGFGHVGREVVRILTAAFASTPLVWNRTPRDDEIREAGGVPATLDTIFSSCSAVTLHANAPADGTPLVGSSLLELARPDLIVVNTARGALVDPKALAGIMRTRPRTRVLADVYPDEPVCPSTDDYGLLELGVERFLLTPHMAYSSDASVRAMGSMVAANLQAHLDGRVLPHLAGPAAIRP